MTSSYQVPMKTEIARFFLRPIFRGIFHLISRVQIRGKENVPPKGPYLIAINHVSLFDPPLAVAFWPAPPEAIGAVDIWSRPGQSTLVRWYGGIKVHRGEYDRMLIETMLEVLQSGRPLLIAPEGRRSHNPGMQQAHPGVAYMMDRAQVPVVPVGIVGTTDDFLQRGLKGERPVAQIIIGKPFKLAPISSGGQDRREARQRNADLIMAHIASLLPEAYRGIYAHHPYLSEQASLGG